MSNVEQMRKREEIEKIIREEIKKNPDATYEEIKKKIYALKPDFAIDPYIIGGMFSIIYDLINTENKISKY